MSDFLQHVVFFNGEWTWLVILSIVILVAVITVTSIKLWKLKKKCDNLNGPAPEDKD